MENRKELLEQYMEDGKLPLKGELFARKSVVGIRVFPRLQGILILST